jgi:iron(III) transport system substrate-binding protein
VRFIEYLLTPEAQKYFADNTHEYPLVAGVETNDELPPLTDVKPPEVDLSDLGDLKGSLEMMRDVGLLP